MCVCACVKKIHKTRHSHKFVSFLVQVTPVSVIIKGWCILDFKDNIVSTSYKRLAPTFAFPFLHTHTQNNFALKILNLCKYISIRFL